MSHDNPMKWHMPGWRIEQKYSPGVLIGNWGEEQHTFARGTQQHNSTHRQDFRTWHGSKPDVIVRRKALQRNDGLNQELLFNHHGNQYSNNMISGYDEHFNYRDRGEQAFPPLRTWDGNKLAWAPEKSDYPLQGSPTNFNLRENNERKWKEQLANEMKGDYLSTYQDAYLDTPPKEAYVTERYAIPRDRSSSLHPYNKINKDLHLRSVNMVKMPETLAAVSM